MRSALLLSTVLCACTATNDEPEAWDCETDTELGDNEVVGTVDGEAWSGTTGGYQALPTGLQFPGYQSPTGMTFRLVFSAVQIPPTAVGENPDWDEGDAIEDVLAAQETPVEFHLHDANRDGSDVTVAVDGEPARSTGEGSDSGGYLKITSIDDQDGEVHLQGCFFFSADTAERGDPVSVEAGSFHLLPF